MWQDFPEISTERLAVHNGKKVIKTVLMNQLLCSVISMDKSEFIDRLALAAERAKRFAETLEYVDGPIPSTFCFSMFPHNDPSGRQPPEGKVKFFGGRVLSLQELECLPLSRAGSLIWVDGKIPRWVNIGVREWSYDKTEFLVTCSMELVEANLDNLYPDIGTAPRNDIMPFRIRGPADPKGQ